MKGSISLLKLERRCRQCIATFILALAATGSAPAANYVAHEWGTFTSVQGADGVLLGWRPLETSKLPGFVYNWTMPGCGRQASGAALGAIAGKGAMETLQRMETPVIYFYSDRSRSVDVQVDFPKGVITEWYPQAAQIGPSIVAPVPAAVAELDSAARWVGASPGFTFETLLNNHAIPQSRARWTGVEILPQDRDTEMAKALPQDSSGSHYFAARETDANYLQLKSFSATNRASQHEKFLFYRGVGDFVTPLRVTQGPDRSLTLANTGKEPLPNLFVLVLRERQGEMVAIEDLAPAQQHILEPDWLGRPVAQAELSKQVTRGMEAALVKAGLYPREAAAMVKTWQDSWFAEDGVRVLYVLPRAWTDRTLPLRLDPAPRELARVMVGRAEVITSAQRQELAEVLLKAQAGDEEARVQAVASLKKLGRFADPVMRLAASDLKPEVTQEGLKLLQYARTP
jgi:hypothetical protein